MRGVIETKGYYGWIHVSTNNSDSKDGKDEKSQNWLMENKSLSSRSGNDLWQRYLKALKQIHEKGERSLGKNEFPMFFCSLFFTHSISLIAAS